MKITSRVKKLSVSVISAIGVSVMVLGPVYALAGTGSYPNTQVNKTQPTQKTTSTFCTNLSNETSTITSKLTGLIGTADQHWSKDSQSWSSIWQKVDQEVTTDRQKSDTARTQNFTKLEAKATTDAEKQAVKTYETALNNAVSTRRAAYDTARIDFRDGVQAAISQRNSTVTAQFNSFEASVNSAVASAQASCASDPSSGPATRDTLISALKSARETFQGDRKGDSTIKSQVQQLAVTRNASFKAADQTFQTSASAAAQALKQAFGSKSGSV